MEKDAQSGSGESRQKREYFLPTAGLQLLREKQQARIGRAAIARTTTPKARTRINIATTQKRKIA